jgi:hypothetical protein
MLGADSSRIVRSVGCAALTLLLAATTCPTFGAPTARAVESPSAAQLSRLPDATLIKLKTGRTVSLGILRSEHKLRLQRFADAAKLGKEHGASVPATPGVYVGPLTRLTHGTPLPQGALVPMDFSQKAFSANFVKYYWPPAGDYLAFCKAALATACLYVPSGVPLIFDPNGGAAYDYDPFDGISWSYPLKYSQTFNSGPTAQGYNVTQSANCPSPFLYVVDPQIGLVALSYNTSSMGMNLYEQNMFPSLQSCFVSVFAKK